MADETTTDNLQPPLESTRIVSFQDVVPQLKSQYSAYEDAFFKYIKDELLIAQEHPGVAAGVTFTAAILLLRGPRKFVFRHTLGRFESEEARYVRCEKKVKEFASSVDSFKKAATKELQNSTLAEKVVMSQSRLRNAGREMQRYTKSIGTEECKALDLMNKLRYITGGDALRLRGEVATVAATLKELRMDLEKKTEEISDKGIHI